MLQILILLAQLTSAPPLPPPVDEAPSVTATIRLDDEREAVVTYGADGKPVRAVVRRIDGQPMTCDTFMAWHSQNSACNGSCSSTLLAHGWGRANAGRYAACEAARADACAEATCSSGSYMHCSLNYSYSGWNGGSGCNYYQFRDCPVPDDCSVE